MNATPPFAPHLYFCDARLVGPLDAWPDTFAHVAGMGFDHVLIGGFWAAGAAGFPRHVADFHRPAATFATRAGALETFSRLAQLARGHGLRMLLEVVPDRIARENPLRAEHPDWYVERAHDDALIDPRCAAHELDIAHAQVGDDAAHDARAAWWCAHLSAFADAGAAGFLIDAPHHLPAAWWPGWRAALRRARPDVAVLASVPGHARDALAQLEAAGFDAVFSSARWWDLRAPWFVDEHRLLRRIGSPIAFPDAFDGPRLADAWRGAPDETLVRAYRRALWTAAAVGTGWLVPMGFERGVTLPLMARDADAARYRAAFDGARFDLSGALADANAWRRATPVAAARGEIVQLSAPGANATALLRGIGPSLEHDDEALLIALNPDLDAQTRIDPATILPGVPGGFTRVATPDGTHKHAPVVLEAFTLEPGGYALLEAWRAPPATTHADAAGERAALSAALAADRIAIERVEPAVDGGRFAIKRVIGETLVVHASIFSDGHAHLAAALQWRAHDEDDWREAPFVAEPNDRWHARIALDRLGRHAFRVVAWRDDWASLVTDVAKKRAAGQDVTLEVREAQLLLATALKLADPAEPHAIPRMERLAADFKDASHDARLALLDAPELADAYAALRYRPFVTHDDAVYPVDVERRAARFSSWYEMFPRSASDDPHRHGTFDDVIAQLPRIRDMGFDVLYFPPIHPIGTTARKGRNNSLKAGPDDVGSPYAIGSADGGHTAVHPRLGTLASFRALVDAARVQGLEIALDFAIQCSPDHPWLAAHPGWFAWRPDGSLRYAENPPKRYQDIVNPDFYAPDALPDLWLALRDAVLFWVETGVRIFRVDNPHTKPLPFWAWMIADVRGRHPDVVFLSEAFTRPGMMYRLAKIGFSQSYTYFTWRETKREFIDYLTELTAGPAREFFRPNFFVNTPDINPRHLQNAPRTQFVIRAALAATLAGSWGLYSGFELGESAPLPDSEEYADAEKYELRARDWSKAAHIGAEIARLNRARRDHPALQTHLGVGFVDADNDQVLVFVKATPAHDSVVVVAISLDPWHPQAANFTLDASLWRGFGLVDGEPLDALEQDAAHAQTWRGHRQYVSLDPHVRPYSIWRLAPSAGAARVAAPDPGDARGPSAGAHG
ncbi:alpha-1,4-glucan--maltose-1-phosphate maltosyltransferase [Burkholderia anthina]|uniref:alpha-1,4-glucan--maltose-1-phosphate maltosyltransferase n=1 Tax=Burkholderia anthina TaxID=179879 RepID=UPI00158DACEA|nr:alpha-1,4-glucan--maltose-1-phosphate maltosyltransferase [Burkholderia anthina]